MFVFVESTVQTATRDSLAVTDVSVEQITSPVELSIPLILSVPEHVLVFTENWFVVIAPVALLIPVI